MSPLPPSRHRSRGGARAGEAAALGAATVSAVIPTLDEECRLEGTLARLQEAPEVEIIVADGGSRDGTVAAARRCRVRVVGSVPGRARQMNAGARAARGGILLFLHADTLPPPGFAAHLKAVLADPEVALGAFPFRLDRRRPDLWLVERLVALRCRLLRLPYGDQGLFMRRSVFERLGGFRDLPVMEDFDLVRRSRALGRVALAPEPATTSARRWRARGVVRTTFLHQVCLLAYLLGVAPARIASWREAGGSRRRRGRERSTGCRPARGRVCEVRRNPAERRPDPCRGKGTKPGRSAPSHRSLPPPGRW